MTSDKRFDVSLSFALGKGFQRDIQYLFLPVEMCLVDASKDIPFFRFLQDSPPPKYQT